MLKTKYLEKGIKINSASRERNVKKGYGCKTRTWKEFFKVILTNMTSQSFSDTAEFLQFLSKSSGVQLNNRDVEQKAVHMRCLCLDIPEQESLSSGSKCNLEVLAIISSEFRGFLKKIKDKGVWQSYVGLPRLPVFVSFANQQFAEKDAKIKFHRISMGFFTKKVNITENESIHATITEHRRITLRNVMRWSQQILTSMNCLHKNYITLTPVSLHEVYLQSDWPIVRGIWEITRSKTAPRKKNEDPHRNIPRGNGGRQAWLDITHGGIAQPKNSVEDFSNHENSNHFYVELRKMDSLGSGILTLK